jgi:ABC-type transport system substrate-binding protein
LAAWEPGQRATLEANPNFSGGRPFVNAVEIQLNRPAQERLLDLELNKTDLAEISPEQARRAAERNVRITRSRPDELLAIVLTQKSSGPSASERRAMEAVASSLDRSSIVNFILQKEGESAGALLPQWSTGTAFLFSAASDMARAKELWAGIPHADRFVLEYDATDALEKSVGERIVVNAREAGIAITAQPFSGGESASTGTSARLIRWRMPSSEPRVAMKNLIDKFSLQAGADVFSISDSADAQAIYDAEREILETHMIVPVVWLPQVFGLSARVRDWKTPEAGETWPLADVWLEPSDSGAQKP